MKLPISERAKVNATGHYPAAATAAVVTLAAAAGEVHVIKGIQGTYSATPTGGGLTVVAGSTTLLDVHIAAAGYFELRLPPEGLTRHVENEAVVVTLASGAGAVVGKLNVQYA